MKKGNTQRVERTYYLLEMGIDFQANDLEVLASNGVNELRGLTKNFRDSFNKLNIGKLVFSGHFDKETKTVLVQAETDLYV